MEVDGERSPEVEDNYTREYKWDSPLSPLQTAKSFGSEDLATSGSFSRVGTETARSYASVDSLGNGEVIGFCAGPWRYTGKHSGTSPKGVPRTPRTPRSPRTP